MNKIVRNEERKLRANFFNGVAIAAIGIGGLTQAASMIQSASVLPAMPFFVVICLASSYFLHLAGKIALREMEE